MSINVQVILILCFWTFQTVYTIDDTNCQGAIGRTPTTYNPASRTLSGISGLFLNTNDGSTCSGMVIAWEFCYYVNVLVADLGLFEVQVGIWREQEKEYRLVNNSLTDLPIPDPDSGVQFVCRSWNLNSSEMFKVQEGDIVGMYVENKSNKIHLLGMIASSEQDGNIHKTSNITDIMLPISSSQLSTTSLSLYLMALIGSLPEASVNSSEPSVDKSLSKTDYYIAIIAGLSAFILLLFTIIIVVISKFCHMQKSTMGRTPVLIKYANGRLSRIIPILQKPDMCEIHTNDANINSSIQTAPLQPATQEQSSLSHSSLAMEVQGDQHEDITPSDSNMNPPLKVYRVTIDDEQQTDDQDKVLVKLQPSAKNNLIRPHSTNDILNSTWTRSSNGDDAETHVLASTEYPYVLHTFEVVGKQVVQAGSLPDILSQPHASMNPNQHQKMCYGDTIVLQNKDNRPNSDSYVDAHVDCNWLDRDSEPSYSYTDNTHNMIRQNIPRFVPKMHKNKLELFKYDNNDEIDDDNESPLIWTKGTKKISKVTDLMENHQQPLRVACVNPLQSEGEDKSSTSEVLGDSTDYDSYRYTKLLGPSTNFDNDSQRYTRICSTALIQLESSACDLNEELTCHKE